MWRCEQILEAEHREWLRLMMQAEWFWMILSSFFSSSDYHAKVLTI